MKTIARYGSPRALRRDEVGLDEILSDTAYDMVMDFTRLFSEISDMRVGDALKYLAIGLMAWACLCVFLA